MYGLENIGAGLGAGFLQGSADVKLMQQQFEKQSELNQMQLYANLLKSGRWAPVDREKGVAEGGVIKVGGIGMLAPVQDSKKDLQEQELLLRISKMQQDMERSMASWPLQQRSLAAETQIKEEQAADPFRGQRPPGKRGFISEDRKSTIWLEPGEAPPEGFFPVGSMAPEARDDSMGRALLSLALRNDASQLSAQLRAAQKVVADTQLMAGLGEESDNPYMQMQRQRHQAALEEIKELEERMRELGEEMLELSGGTGLPAAQRLIEKREKAREAERQKYEPVYEDGGRKVRGRIRTPF